MSYYFRKIAFKSGLENEGLYIFLPTFLEELRLSYDNSDPEFEEELGMIKKCKFLNQNLKIRLFCKKTKN